MKNLRSLLITILLCSLFHARPWAQVSQGIYFESNLSWAAAKQKAKNENKYIFVDCYATWCGPCKAMDKEVYPSDTLGAYVNEHFVSIKYQMDTSKNDNQLIKGSYQDAHDLFTGYGIKIFPTYLFFTADGQLVHRDAGYQTVQEFLQLVQNVKNPEKQYGTFLSKYENGEKEYTIMSEMAERARKIGQMTLARKLAEDYIRNYFPGLDDDQLFSKENLLLMAWNMDLLKSKDRLFQLISRNPLQTDKLTFPSFANQVICVIIKQEEISDKLWSDPVKSIPISSKPDWEKMKASIKKKYGKKYADSLVSRAMFDFFPRVKDWNGYANLVEKTLKQFPPQVKGKKFVTAFGGLALASGGDDARALNSVAWELFSNATEEDLLKKGLAWSSLSISLTDTTSRDIYQAYDTKANLLYKLGVTQEAIATEQRAIELLKKYEYPQLVDRAVKEFNANIEKMQKGEPTWKTK